MLAAPFDDIMARTIKIKLKTGASTKYVRAKNTAALTNMISTVLFMSFPSLSYIKTAMNAVNEIIRVATVNNVADVSAANPRC